MRGSLLCAYLRPLGLLQTPSVCISLMNEGKRTYPYIMRALRSLRADDDMPEEVTIPVRKASPVSLRRYDTLQAPSRQNATTLPKMGYTSG